MTDRVFPPELEELEIWVCWQFDSKGRKRPRAPWLDGHGYPVSWGEGVEPRPETDLETALKYAQLHPFELDAFGIDFEPDIPEKSLETGLILPHDVDGQDRRLTQIDLDDVRDPETGELHPEAQRLVDELEAYGSTSVSGEGVHLLIWSRLPPSKGKYIGELDDEPFADLASDPQIEIYDHGRHVALTGQHLPETPLEIPELPDVVDELIDRYPDATEDEDDEHSSSDEDDDVDADLSSVRSGGSSGSSPYYEHSLTDFAEPRANIDKRSTEVQGAHPVHGGTSSSDDESANYNIDKRSNMWHCFAHDSGGGPLKMVAVMEGKLRCGACTEGALDRLTDADFLEVCLAARDLGFEGPPPYRALVELARREGLALKDPEEGVLGRSAYSVAEQIFEHY